MREVHDFVIVSAALKRDAEARRWYSQGARACLVLTERRRLLEPYPIFGPTSYRLLACNVSTTEAHRYAREHGFPHPRVPPQPRRAR